MEKFIETTMSSCLEHSRSRAKGIQSFCDGTSQSTGSVSEVRQLGRMRSTPNVRLGSSGDIAAHSYDVRFTPEADIETAGVYEYTP
jgi:hypothetical protein